MKKIFNGLMAIAVAAAAFSGCTDEVKFGSSFIEKAPGGTVTIDTVFSSPVYTQQFLTALYARQYYGLPYSSSVGMNSSSPYTGKFDALTDCYSLHWSNTAVRNRYYTGTMTANDTPLMGFTSELVWEVVRQGWLLIENIDKVPGFTDEEKNYIVAQAKCLIAARYFDLFTHYGGLPLVDHTYTGTEGSFEITRGTVEETVEFMVNLLDEAIPNLYWAFNGNTTATNESQMGRWTQAGAMALKAKILTIAASPLFNADQPYYNGSTQAETEHMVWYGNYDPARWQRALKACKDFFDKNNANGNYYHMYEATSKTPDGYRQAYRMGYILDNSPEVLHYTRVAATYGTQGTYCWWSWGMGTSGINRNNYTPTQEYIDMFPWKDGTPFDWETDSLAGRIAGANGRLFYKYTSIRGGVKKEAARDPRLYENAIVNGQQITLDWTSGVSTGNIYEFWVGGYHAANSVIGKDGTIAESDATICPTGYGNIKYLLGEEYHRKYDMHWNYLTYPEMCLMYAECLCQTGDLATSLTYVNQVRNRVGLGNIEACNPSLNLASNKDNLLEEILRERACELGLTNNRFYDMVRYKRTDWMTREQHGLAIWRLQQNSSGQWVRKNGPYLGDDKNNGVVEPSRFEYWRFPLKVTRVWWDEDPNSLELKKWFLSPFPQTELNKNYGLVQNPGW